MFSSNTLRIEKIIHVSFNFSSENCLHSILLFGYRCATWKRSRPQNEILEIMRLHVIPHKSALHDNNECQEVGF
jgi:hypothetical protein